jgi:hypothetical protein
MYGSGSSDRFERSGFERSEESDVLISGEIGKGTELSKVEKGNLLVSPIVAGEVVRETPFLDGDFDVDDVILDEITNERLIKQENEENEENETYNIDNLVIPTDKVGHTPFIRERQIEPLKDIEQIQPAQPPQPTEPVYDEITKPLQFQKIQGGFKGKKENIDKKNRKVRFTRRKTNKNKITRKKK